MSFKPLDEDQKKNVKKPESKSPDRPKVVPYSWPSDHHDGEKTVPQGKQKRTPSRWIVDY